MYKGKIVGINKEIFKVDIPSIGLFSVESHLILDKGGTCNYKIGDLVAVEKLNTGDFIITGYLYRGEEGVVKNLDKKISTQVGNQNSTEIRNSLDQIKQMSRIVENSIREIKDLGGLIKDGDFVILNGGKARRSFNKTIPVQNILEFNSFYNFPNIGNLNKFYKDLSTDLLYTWDKKNSIYRIQ